jgi:hypothetical protein
LGRTTIARTDGVVNSPERSATEAAIICQLQLLSERTCVVESDPLIIPGHLIHFSTTSDDFPGHVLLIDQASNLASAQDTILERARTCFAGTGKCATVVHAVLVSDGISTTVVGDAHVDLLRVDVAGPERIERIIDFLEIGMRP